MDINEDDNGLSLHVQGQVQLGPVDPLTAATLVQQSQLEARWSLVDPPIFNLPRHNVEL